MERWCVMFGRFYIRREQEMVDRDGTVREGAKEAFACEILADLIPRALALDVVVKAYEAVGNDTDLRAALLDRVAMLVRCFVEDANEALARSRRADLFYWDQEHERADAASRSPQPEKLRSIGGPLPCYGP